MTIHAHDDEPRNTNDCRDCAGASSSRREFLQVSAGSFGVALALFGLGSADAVGLPVLMAQGSGTGAERRYPIPAIDSVNIDHGAQLIVARFENKVAVFALSCPHQNNAVKWLPKDRRFQCTKHDSQYQPDGVYTSGHATRNLDRYVIRRDADMVVVDLHHWIQSDKDPTGWASATVGV